MPRLFRSSRSDVPSGDGAPVGWAHERPTPPEVLRGRYEFTRQFSDLAKGKRNWQWVAALSLVLLGLAVGGLVTLASQSRVVPYVVEVDRMGRAEAIAPAEAAVLAEDRVVVAALSSFVSNIRTVYADPVAQRDAVYRAYAHVAGDARDFLEGYFSDPQNDPRHLGKDFRRAVEVTAVLPVPGTDQGTGRTYRVQWNETDASTQGGERERAWEGYASVTLAPPTTTEGIERNPLGVFVTDLSWSPLAGQTTRTERDDDTDEAEPGPPAERPARRPRQTVRAPGDTTPRPNEGAAPSNPDLR